MADISQHINAIHFCQVVRDKVINNKKKNLGKKILNNSSKERDTNEKDWGGKKLGKEIDESIYTNNRIFGNLFSTNILMQIFDNVQIFLSLICFNM